MIPDTEHRQCPHQGEEPHNYPDDEDWWDAVEKEAKSLQLHQVPVSGTTAPVTLSYTNLKYRLIRFSKADLWIKLKKKREEKWNNGFEQR
jgi:hypothetical protein